MRGAIVLTTINVPNLLEDYAKNLRNFGHSDVGFIVIGDRRTPDEKCRKVIDRLKTMDLKPTISMSLPKNAG